MDDIRHGRSRSGSDTGGTARKGRAARKTQQHRVRTRYRRVDKVDGETYEDWFEQQLNEVRNNSEDKE